ncbi:MAG: porin family protein [Bacteroidales bacterium]
MRKTIILLAFVIAALLDPKESNAQFAFGLKAGYNASSLSTNIDTIKSNMSSGFHAGAFARIGKKVHLQPEFYYTLSGGTFQIGTNTLTDWKQKVTIGTLDIPLLIGFTIIDSKTVKWRIMVGPEASFVVNSKVENLNLTGPLEKADLRTTNWFIQAGTGIDLLFMTLDLRYQTGLNSLINDVTTPANGYTTPYPVNSKSNLFVVSLGFKIM